MVSPKILAHHLSMKLATLRGRKMPLRLIMVIIPKVLLLRTLSGFFFLPEIADDKLKEANFAGKDHKKQEQKKSNLSSQWIFFSPDPSQKFSCCWSAFVFNPAQIFAARSLPHFFFCS